MELTPGMRYVGRWTLSSALPVLALFLLLVRFLQAAAGVSLSAGGSFALFVVMSLIISIGFIVFTEVSQRRKAAAHGARLIPRVRGYLPGNVDVLLDMIWRTETAYLGSIIQEKMSCEPVVNFRFLWEDVIMTTEPHDIKTILATDFNNYLKGDKFKATADSVLGTGVFNSDGDTWKLHRSMARPFFSIDRISHFDIFDRHAETVVTLMKERFRAGLAVDFQDIVSRFTLDSASEFLFGNCINSLVTGLPYPHNFSGPELLPKDSNITLDFAAAFSAALQALAGRNFIGGSWPLFEIFKDPTRKPMEVVNAFLEPIMRDAIAKQKVSQELSDVDKGIEGETLLDHLVRQTTDIKVLRDEILNILLAGRDTTASTLTFTIYMMAMHPDILRRLREEILEKVGPTRRPTYEDIRELKFLRAVLNETLRLFPAVPFNIRESVNDTIWQSSNPDAKPFLLPAGTTVGYSVLLMQRRTDLWGPDALEFDPDRFLDGRLRKYLAPNPFIFLPFNAGPRICLGQQFAYNEMSFMLIRLLQHFSSVMLSPDSRDPAHHPPAAWACGEGRQAIEQIHPRHHLTLYVKGGLWVKMTPTEI